MSRSRTLKVEILGDASSVKGAFDDAGNEAEGFGSRLGGVAKVATGVVLGLGATAAGAFVAGFGKAAEAEQSVDRLQAKTGITAEEAERLGDIARNVFEGAWGDSIPGVLDDISVLRTNLGEMSDEDLQRLTEKFLTIEDLWGAPVEETSRTVKTLRENFDGLTEDDALDIITKGFQEGGDVSGELLDTLNEYAPAFSNIGLNAEQFLGTLIAGSDAGAFNVDKVGDAMKEFEIRAQDASETTSDAFTALGLDADQMGQAIAEGGEAGERAFQATLVALAAIEDPVERNRQGVALFGTQWEDLGESVVLSMTEGLKGVEGLEGATERAGEAAYSNLGTVWEGIKRQAIGALTEAATPALMAVSEALNEHAGPALQTFGEFLNENVAPALAAFGVWFQEEGIPALQEFGEFINENVVPVLQTMGEWFVEEGIPAIQEFGEFIQTVFEDVIQPAIQMLADEVLPELIEAWDEISAEVIPTIEALQSYIETVFGAISDFLEEHWDTISAIAERVWQYISETIGNLIQIISETIQLAMNIIQGDWEGAWENIKGILNAAKDQLLAVGGLIKDGLIGLFNLMRDEGVQIMQQLADLAIEKLIALGDWMLTEGGPQLVSKLVSGLQQLFSTDTAAGVVGLYLRLSEMLGEKIIEIADWMLTEGGPKLVQFLIDGLSELVPRALEAFQNVQTAANEAFINAGQWLFDAGLDIIQGLIDGIKSKIPSFNDVLGGITDSIPDLKGPPEKDKKLLYQNGQLIIEGLIKGFEDMTDALVETLHEMTEAIVAAIEAGYPALKAAGAGAGSAVVEGTSEGMGEGARSVGAAPAQAKPKPVGVAMGRNYGEGVAEGVVHTSKDGQEAGQRVGGAIARGTGEGMEAGARAGGSLPASPHPRPVGRAMGRDFGEGTAEGIDEVAHSPGYASHFYDAGQIAAQATQQGWEDDWEGYDATESAFVNLPDAAPDSQSGNADNAGPTPNGDGNTAPDSGGGGGSPVGFLAGSVRLPEGDYTNAELYAASLLQNPLSRLNQPINLTLNVGNSQLISTVLDTALPGMSIEVGG